MSRYKRLVPQHHREMIARHRHPKPNWFVGAAEQPAVPRDPELRREIEELKRELRGEGHRIEQAQSGGSEPTASPPSAEPAEPDPAPAASRTASNADGASPTRAPRA